MTSPFKVVFMGTPDISVPSLQICHQMDGVEVVAIVSQPDRPSGRGKKLKSPPVAEFAKEQGLKLFQSENINKDSELFEYLSLQKIDLIVVFAFAQFLGKKYLDLPRLGCFNIHTSLLPKYRGAAPIHYAILNGDKTSGISIQRMVKKMDAGDICYSKEVKIGDSETGGELYQRFKELAPNCLFEVLTDAIKDRLVFSPQDEAQVSFAPIIKKEEGRINFQKEKATQIYNRVRAFNPFPSCFFEIEEMRVKIFETAIFDNVDSESPGKIENRDGRILAHCKEGVLLIKELQLPGKKRMTNSEFINGLGDRLWKKIKNKS